MIPQDAPLPALVVDVDDSLVRGDLLWEQIASLLLRRPMLAPLLPLWLLGGRAAFKARLARAVPLDVESLPLRPSVLDLITSARRDGRRVVLATASHELVARELGRRVGTDDVLATTDELNLKGDVKAAAIRARVGGPFDYVGDSAADLATWRDAARCFVVNPGPRLLARVRGIDPTAEALRDERGWKPLVRALRIHQWSKNVLVAVPAIAGHQLGPALRDGSLALAFAVFSLLASAVYVVNDLADLASDRRHPTKRSRPLASGDLSIRSAMLLLPVLLASAALLATRLPRAAWVPLLVYVLMNAAYAAWARSQAVTDVIFLASFYVVRIAFGAAATSVPVSEWLFSYAAVFFFGLALVKRHAELRRVEEADAGFGRGYRPADRSVLLALGVSSSLLSVLITMLYFSSEKVRQLYSRPEILWLLLPLQLHWISRAWLLSARGEVHDDPVTHALRDPGSWATGAAAALILWAAT